MNIHESLDFDLKSAGPYDGYDNYIKNQYEGRTEDVNAAEKGDKKVKEKVKEKETGYESKYINRDGSNSDSSILSNNSSGKKVTDSMSNSSVELGSQSGIESESSSLSILRATTETYLNTGVRPNPYTIPVGMVTLPSTQLKRAGIAPRLSYMGIEEIENKIKPDTTPEKKLEKTITTKNIGKVKNMTDKTSCKQFYALHLDQFIQAAFTVSLNVRDIDFIQGKKRGNKKSENNYFCHQPDGLGKYYEGNAKCPSSPKKKSQSQRDIDADNKNVKRDDQSCHYTLNRLPISSDESVTKSLREIIVDDVVGGIERGVTMLFFNGKASSSAAYMSKLNGDNDNDNDSDSDMDGSDDNNDQCNDDDKDDYEKGKAVASASASACVNTTAANTRNNAGRSIGTRPLAGVVSDVLPGIIPAHTQEPMLPCEFCLELIRLTLLQTHQVECGSSRGQLSRDHRREIFAPTPPPPHPPLLPPGLPVERGREVEDDDDYDDEDEGNQEG